MDDGGRYVTLELKVRSPSVGENSYVWNSGPCGGLKATPLAEVTEEQRQLHLDLFAWLCWHLANEMLGVPDIVIMVPGANA